MRLMMVLVPAALVTFGLQMVMVTLIQFADGRLDKTPVIKLPDIYMPKAEIQTQRSVEKPEKPQLDDTPPPDVPQQAFDQVDGNAQVGLLSGPSQVATNLDLSMGSGLSATDGEYLPIVKVAPNYPRAALSRGLEGDVILEYTVTKQGSVRDPVVIESSNPTFNAAAMESAMRYKYKPRVVDGSPIEVPGVRTRVMFRLDKSS
ncbi:energy transducer TonB [Flagellatimonas centrodinii]|uniref:energy transducer TonB n=1 Tax=Flagellatimonas centrodinii TaxID=2806210 RepID=UPI001FEFEF0B|nr:energy transducer TonB [Flagellatimonas centrodinii]ULQ45799.1 energy transducer TonB [Flagellatimonas centrodinii]